MYVVRVKVDKSTIEGRGVFALSNIKKGEVVWKFTKRHDLKMLPQDYEKLGDAKKTEINKIGYLSPSTRMYVFPPKDDPARFTNHSGSNNLTAVFDPKVSEEPYFIASRDIKKGEELTNNYLEFDKVVQTIKPSWA